MKRRKWIDGVTGWVTSLSLLSSLIFGNYAVLNYVQAKEESGLVYETPTYIDIPATIGNSEETVEYEPIVLHKPIDILDSIVLRDDTEFEQYLVVNIPEPEPEIYIPWETIELLAKCIYAEAGNQDETGKRLVCDVILNRCEKFNATIEEVIYAPHQFEVVTNGSIWRYTPGEDIYQIIDQELKAEHRFNEEVLYFRTLHYHTFGTPLFQWGDHWFSK